MEKAIDILKLHFGSYEKVSNELGITTRRLYDLRHGQRPGKSLEKLITRMAAEIQIQHELEKDNQLQNQAGA